MEKRGLTALALLLGAAVLAAQSSSVEKIDKFFRVSDQVATGAQPTLAQIDALAGEGYKTVVNLRETSEHDAVAEERAAREAGLRYVGIPVKTAAPHDAEADAFLKILSDPEIYPVFIHCGSGNRVGAFWMIRRILVDKQTVEDAQQEAVRIGLKSPNLKEFALDYAQRRSSGKM